jgi:type I restriction enzyme S subunit
MTFPRYTKYRSAGVDWLGEIPDQWTTSSIKNTTYLKGRVGWKGLTSDEYEDSGFAYLITGTDFDSKLISWKTCHFVDRERYDDDPFIQLRNGDLLITKDGTIGKLALVSGLDRPACLNSGIFLVRPLRSYTTEFMYWVLSSDAFRVFCDLSSLGSTIQHLYQNVFERFVFPVPSVDEQLGIAAFLDAETARIDALIAEQRRLIELLNEERLAVISHSVTKGPNPDAPMKPSGIEWLGDVPAHWAVGKCGFHLSILSGFAFPSEGFSHDDNDVRLLRGVNVGVSTLKWDDVVYWRRSYDDGMDAYEMSAGDLVVGLDRPVIADGVRVAKVTEADLPCLLLQRVACLKTTSTLNVDYLHILLSSAMFVAHFSPETTGVSVPHISPQQIHDFVIPIPPIAEQKQIAAHVEAESGRAAALILHAERAVALLLERRSALISASVTGQIDVRTVMGRVPAESARHA